MLVFQNATLLGYMLVCSFTPGPGNILALNTTSRYGWKKGLRLVLGICMGYALVQLLCTLALYELNSVFGAVLEILKYAGSVYMIWLAIHMMRSKPETSCDDKLPTFREGMLLQLVNVKIYFYIMTLLSVYFIPHLHTASGLLFAGAIAVGIGSAASVIWAVLGAGLQALYQKHYRCINVVLGFFLIYCAWTMIRG